MCTFTVIEENQKCPQFHRLQIKIKREDNPVDGVSKMKTFSPQRKVFKETDMSLTTPFISTTWAKKEDFKHKTTDQQ